MRKRRILKKRIKKRIVKRLKRTNKKRKNKKKWDIAVDNTQRVPIHKQSQYSKSPNTQRVPIHKESQYSKSSNTPPCSHQHRLFKVTYNTLECGLKNSKFISVTSDVKYIYMHASTQTLIMLHKFPIIPEIVHIPVECNFF